MRRTTRRTDERRTAGGRRRRPAWRGAAAGGTVVALAGAGVALPTVALPVPEARAVPPRVEAVEVHGVDRAARARAGALAEAVGHGHGDSGDQGRAAQNGSARSAQGPDDGHGEGALAALNARTTTDEFLVAGVTWDAGTPVEVTEVALRVREDGRWTEWQSLGVDGGGDDDADAGAEIEGGRAGTEPFMTTGADGVQLRVRTADGGSPDGLRVDLVDPGTSPADANVGADTGPASSADAGTGFEIRPDKMLSRSQWGADESLSSSWPEVSGRLKAVYVHHTAGTNSYTEGQSAALVRGIYAYHTKSRGWPDIGYQFLVDKFGNMFQGRKYARVDNPIGAQAGGFNTGTVGVSAMGNYETARPTRALMRGLAKVIAWKTYQYEIHARGWTSLVSGGGSTARWGAGTRVSVPNVVAHRKTNRTACPGKYLVAELNDLRLNVDKRRQAAIERHGAIRWAVARPTRYAPTSAQTPVQWKPGSTYRWKPVPGAIAYQVLYRQAHWDEDMPSGLYWRVLDGWTTSTSIDTTMWRGEARELAVRAIGPHHERGPVTTLVRTSRVILPKSWTFSGGWTRVTNWRFHSDEAFRTTTRGATIRLKGANQVRRIVLRAATSPGDGRVQVLVGGEAFGTFDLDRAKDLNRILQLRLPRRVDGTVTLRALDGDRVRISRIALHRW